MPRPLPGLIALSIFFGLGAATAGLSGVALLLPGSRLEPMWHLHPQAHDSLVTLGTWGIALMFTVVAACALSAIGLWIGARWGRRLALGLLAVNMAGNITSAIIRSDYRTLIGLPIAGLMIAYLIGDRVRRHFTVGTT